MNVSQRESNFRRPSGIEHGERRWGDILRVQPDGSARSMPAEVGSAFAGDSAYASFFTALFRHLHRSSPRHVLLLRERGVGEQAALVELARRHKGVASFFDRGRSFLYPFKACHDTFAISLPTFVTMC